MQWLIDIIKELIHGQLGFFNRGDPGAPDWTQATLTADWNWHVLDCSAIVPEDARAIVLNIGIMDDIVARRIHIRKFGNVNTFNRSELRTQVAFLHIFQDVTCPCDSSRRLEYRMTNAIWDFATIIVKGWWLR